MCLFSQDVQKPESPMEDCLQTCVYSFYQLFSLAIANMQNSLKATAGGRIRTSSSQGIDILLPRAYEHIILHGVFVSWVSHSKISQMWWLKTAEFCSLRVLEAEVPMRYRGAPSAGSIETVLLAFPTSPRGSRGPSAHVSTAQSLPPSSHGLLPFPHRNPVLGLRIHLLNPGGSPHEIPNLTVFAEVPLPSKVPVHQARFRGFRCGQPFWGPPFGLPVCCSQLGKEKHMAGCARGWL